MNPISRHDDSTLLKRAAKLHSSVLKDTDENLKKQVRKKKKKKEQVHRHSLTQSFILGQLIKHNRLWYLYWHFADI